MIEDRARVIAQIWELAASGLGQVRIVKQLNREGAPTLNGSAKWGCGMIGHLLTNQAVVGVFLPRRYVIKGGKRLRLPDLGGAIEGYFPAIISNHQQRSIRGCEASMQTSKHAWREPEGAFLFEPCERHRTLRCLR